MYSEDFKISLINQGLEPELANEMLALGRKVTLLEGNLLFPVGSKASEMPLVVKGTLRVMREDEKGNEVFLYYLEAGEVCAMSIRCCFADKMSEFKAVAEENTEVWMVPMNQLDGWVTKFKGFRKLVFDSYQDRFDEMLNAIDSIAFMKMDERLMKYLLDKKQSSGSYIIHKTHEQIARELNTSRVVISRLLKKLEADGQIELHRNRVEVL